MLPILQRRFIALENSKAEILQKLRSIPVARLNQRPASGKWSAAELIEHIVKVESGILASVRREFAEQETAQVKLRDRVGSLIVRNVMRSPLRVKIPSELTAIQPGANVDAGAAMAEWDRIRHEWQEFLTHVRASQLKEGVFSHPRAGWFTLPETVLFLRLHHDHHRAQIARIAKALATQPESVAA